MLKFEEFFALDKQIQEKTKIKFNMNAGNKAKPAWDLLRSGSDEWIDMNAHRKRHANNNLDKAEYLLAFAQYYPYGPQYYIFGGMYEVRKKVPEVINGTGYDLIPVKMFEDYEKRLIIKLDKAIGRDIYNRFYENAVRDLSPEIFELMPPAKAGVFLGYNNVLLSHQDLQNVFSIGDEVWKMALSSVKGVYCITDRATGQLYIGSASGEGGIWERWAAYADENNLTGGNQVFEEIKKRDAEHIKRYFTYSILEIMDIKTKKDFVLDREEYWKKVFQTRQYGMNRN